MICTPSGLPIPSDFHPNGIALLNQIDREAVEAGRAFRAKHNASDLRAIAVECEHKRLFALADINRLMADLLDMPDERMTGAGLLYQAAHSDGRRQMFISDYQQMLAAHVAQPISEAAE